MPPALNFVGYVAAAVLTSVVFVNLFRIVAGARFSSWRHIVTAYFLYFIAAVPIEAIVNDHALEPYKASGYALGSATGAILELVRLGRRTSASN